MSSTNSGNDEFITKLRIALSENIQSRIDYRVMHKNNDPKNLIDILNLIQTDTEFLLKYIKTCALYDSVACEIYEDLKTNAVTGSQYVMVF